jgi:hypothetical protein
MLQTAKQRGQGMKMMAKKPGFGPGRDTGKWTLTKIQGAVSTILIFCAAFSKRADLKKNLDWQALGFVYSNYLHQFCIHYILFKI